MKKEFTIILLITASLSGNTAFAQTASDKPAPKTTGLQSKTISSHPVPLVSSTPATKENADEKRLPAMINADTSVLASEKTIKLVRVKETL